MTQVVNIPRSVKLLAKQVVSFDGVGGFAQRGAENARKNLREACKVANVPDVIIEGILEDIRATRRAVGPERYD